MEAERNLLKAENELVNKLNLWKGGWERNNVTTKSKIHINSLYY
ncbi:transposase [Bacillus thuringiensis serovar andalousiensis BGSC 4AW1]|nr:transposase [Bacillus thuringiensis serovar andalousiensis BGSC 4AW1]